MTAIRSVPVIQYGNDATASPLATNVSVDGTLCSVFRLAGGSAALVSSERERPFDKFGTFARGYDEIPGYATATFAAG